MIARQRPRMQSLAQDYTSLHASLSSLISCMYKLPGQLICKASSNQ